MPGTLYLIPVDLGQPGADRLFPPFNLRMLEELNHLVVENERTARRFIRSVGNKRDFEGLNLILLDKRTERDQLSEAVQLLLSGHDVGLMSEAGCPGIADPGQMLVAEAHRYNIAVKPLIGPSSILLGLMASGLNGQHFTFHGYLPIDKRERVNALRHLDNSVRTTGQTHLFIETPYRNHAMYDEILRTCAPATMLCLAVDITLTTERIRTLRVDEWKAQRPELQKRPCVFLLGA
ncbi:MAG: SAM-dependent methyltransferase [Flavobacteriales bacterium]|nr:SAM-dependent methyltransferase [Flavobacteriales bacterium]